MKTPSEGKDIVNANKTFQFYFSDNDLKVVKDKDGNTPQMTSDDTFLLGFVGGIQVYNDRSLADRTRFTIKNSDLPSDLGYAIVNKRFVEVGGSNDTNMVKVVSMEVWGVKENKDNLNLSTEQWSVLMAEINKLNPNLKSKTNLFNSTL